MTRVILYNFEVASELGRISLSSSELESIEAASRKYLYSWANFYNDDKILQLKTAGLIWDWDKCSIT